MTKNRIANIRIANIRFWELVLLFTANKETIEPGILSGKLTHKSLSEEHGVAPTTIADILTAAGLPTRPTPKAEATASHKELALLTAKTLAKFLRKMGEPCVELEETLHRGGI